LDVLLRQDKERIIFDVQGIEFRFKSGKRGSTTCHLQRIGAFSGYNGSIGSRKITLLNVLNGSEKPSLGKNMYQCMIFTTKKNKLKVKSLVSQDDLLIEELTVYQNLYFTTPNSASIITTPNSSTKQ
jgi:ABC-type lipoprotein export system ATPase subunit